MKKPSKLLLGVTTAAALIAPFTPKTVNINIVDPPAMLTEYKMCNLIATVIDDKGKRFCEYRCDIQVRIIPAVQGYCENTMSERNIK